MAATSELHPLEIIRTGTTLAPVTLVPQIRLYQAGEPVSLWQQMELAADRSDLEPPFWACAWAGGQALARYVLDNPDLVGGRRVIDIASGSGLVAIAAAKAGAASVTAYDVDPLAIAAVNTNAVANDVDVQANCADILDEADFPSTATDVVLVADAFYERELAARITRLISRARARGAAVLVGDFGRAFLPVDSLRPLATYEVTGLRSVEGSDVKRTTVWAPLV